MKVILGTYRGPEFVNRTIDSLNEHARGWTALTIVDDSGNESWLSDYIAMSAEAAEYPDGIQVKVIALNKVGYNRAMQVVCAEAGDEPFVFWEEDFTLLGDVDFDRMGRVLKQRPKLAQLALLRGPHFPIEHRLGGLLPALRRRTGTLLEREMVGAGEHAQEIIVQTGTFTGNPAVWQAGIAALGWPTGDWSEDRKRDQLLEAGYVFGYLPEVLVEHDGERSGYGY